MTNKPTMQFSDGQSKTLNRWLSPSSLFLLSSALNHAYASAQSLDFVVPSTQSPSQEPLPPTEAPLPSSPVTPPQSQDVVPIPAKITVEEFEFVGNTALTREELNQITAEFRGKPITFTQLLQAANQVTNAYIEQGYITSGAYIPSQELKGGKVTIQIVEGSLAEIEVDIVEGTLKPSYVRNRLELAGSKPLNIRQLQEALQRLQFNPLVESLQAQLIAGTQPGTNILKVKITGADTFAVIPSINNNRNPSIGSFERRIEISEANLFGWGDRVSFAYGNTDGSDRLEFNYTVPLNPRDATLSFAYTFADNKIVEPPFDDFEIEIESQDMSLTFRQPILQKATPEVSQELALSLSANRINSNSRLLGVDFPVVVGADEAGETRISALRFGQEWLRRTRQDILSLISQFSLGINVFDATVNRDEPDSRFFAWRGQAVYFRQLSSSDHSQLIQPSILLRSDIQLAITSLVPIEQFSLGGQATVRGYRQDALLRDNGIFVSAELRLPIVQFPQAQGAVQVVPFFDFGTAWNTDRENSDPQTIASWGFGILWQMADTFSARLDWGIPLIELDESDRTWQENGVYFQLQYKL